jgi:hypothetical protein
MPPLPAAHGYVCVYTCKFELALVGLSSTSTVELSAESTVLSPSMVSDPVCMCQEKEVLENEVMEFMARPSLGLLERAQLEAQIKYMEVVTPEKSFVRPKQHWEMLVSKAHVSQMVLGAHFDFNPCGTVCLRRCS